MDVNPDRKFLSESPNAVGCQRDSLRATPATKPDPNVMPCICLYIISTTERVIMLSRQHTASIHHHSGLQPGEVATVIRRDENRTQIQTLYK